MDKISISSCQAWAAALADIEQSSLHDAFRKANGMLHGGPGALNSTLLSMSALENDKEADAPMSIGNPQEKRPALGHKPTHFSSRANIMQVSADLGDNSNIEQLHDPVDFFSADGKLQNAKDERQRHACRSITNINDYIPSANPCNCRQEILRKSVSYMHHYSSAVSENDDTFLSSQEAVQDDNQCPSEFVWQQETEHFDSDLQDKELVESISKTDERINEILDNLLSESIETLDGDGAPSLMQEKLQMEPVIGLEKELPQSRKLQTDTPKLMRGLSGKSPIKIKHVAENPVYNLASPNTPKSPFAALSLLNKHISQLKPISDPFMALDIDLSSSRNASLLEEFNRPSQKVDEQKEELIISNKLTSPTEVEATRTAVNGQSDSSFTKGLRMNGQPRAADSTFRIDLEQLNTALKKGSAKDKSKATHEQKRRKAITGSVKETGTETATYLEFGVRHSKRIRTRPLKYWKGERFLYGRVHESLATVIGIKYMSPAEESGEPTFRVSSYVSDKHKDLVELAARH